MLNREVGRRHHSSGGLRGKFILFQPHRRVLPGNLLVFCWLSLLIQPRRLGPPDVLTFHLHHVLIQLIPYVLNGKSSWISFLQSSKSSLTVVLWVIFYLLGWWTSWMYPGILISSNNRIILFWPSGPTWQLNYPIILKTIHSSCYIAFSILLPFCHSILFICQDPRFNLCLASFLYLFLMRPPFLELSLELDLPFCLTSLIIKNDAISVFIFILSFH